MSILEKLEKEDNFTFHTQVDNKAVDIFRDGAYSTTLSKAELFQLAEELKEMAEQLNP